ncbi:hypothetical protein [Micromonospora sp. SH-82]|uniref:hypothetical protein n=1 Tax=Micromonospora sp. SH-82 TaxID=3132938 RepID=UPI003EBDB1F2
MRLWHEVNPATAVISRARTLGRQSQGHLDAAVFKLASAAVALSWESGSVPHSAHLAAVGTSLRELKIDLEKSRIPLHATPGYLTLLTDRLRDSRSPTADIRFVTDSTQRLARESARILGDIDRIELNLDRTIERVEDLRRLADDPRPSNPEPSRDVIELQATIRPDIERLHAARRDLEFWQDSESGLSRWVGSVEAGSTWADATGRIDAQVIESVRIALMGDIDLDPSPYARQHPAVRNGIAKTIGDACTTLQDAGLRGSPLHHKAVHALHQHLPHRSPSIEVRGTPRSVGAAQLRLSHPPSDPTPGSAPKRRPSENGGQDAKRPRVHH